MSEREAELRRQLIEYLRDHIDKAENYDDSVSLLDLFTCSSCNALRFKLEKLEGRLSMREQLERETQERQNQGRHR